MNFEYDPQKSLANQEKHGIDFETAKNLWKDNNRILFQARSDTEPRVAMIASYKKRLWTAFYTIRTDVIRIISVRRSREEERRLYYES
ncbi:MAG: BrnT family toxin [SAR324 cluster bacterium]|nr:BrnT family toxin [SAR324 cluster bacterium]